MTRRGFVRTAGALAAAALAAPDSAPAAPAPAGGAAIPFRLGFVTYMVAADWDVPTILKVCRNAGITDVELRTTHRHGVEPSLNKQQRQDVRKQFADAGVTLWGLGTTCEFQSPDPSVVRKNIDTCRQFIDLARDVGARGVKVRPNGLPKEVPAEKTLEQIGRSLVPCAQAAADAGVEVWVEVHGGGTQKPANMKTIMEHCGRPNVGVTWNSNAEDVVNGSVAESFALLRPWIKSCHINELYKDSQGRYPYRELFRLLRESGYDRVTLCEVARGMPTPEAGEEMLRYYKALWTELASPAQLPRNG
jgi:sugar phosphate isomerase/epimerase